MAARHDPPSYPNPTVRRISVSNRLKDASRLSKVCDSITNLSLSGLALKGKRARQRTSPFLNLLVNLPTEIHILILEQMTVQDMLVFRGVSKDCSDIVDSCVSPIVRNYARSLEPLHKRLYPPPPPGKANLRYIIDNEHRLRTSFALAELISDFFCDKMLGVRSIRKRKNHAHTYNRIMQGLQPLFFTLGHFFENYRQIILERAMSQWRSNQSFQISTGGPTVWDDQVSILNRYSPNLMLDCYHCYGYLLQVFEHQLRPRRRERLVRSLRGRSINPAATREVEVLLMLGGMEQVSRVLRGKTYGARRDSLDSFINKLKPTTNPGWRQVWKGLGVESPKVQLDKLPSLRLRLPALHLVWVPSALKILLCNKIIDRVDFEAESVSPMDFVYDLLAYDDMFNDDDTANEADDDDTSSDEAVDPAITTGIHGADFSNEEL